MKIVNSTSGKMVLEHADSKGKAINLEVLVDNDSRKFIKENISKIKYDKTNNILKYREDGTSTTVVRAWLNKEANVVPSDRNIRFRDGNKFNLRTKNLLVLE